MLEGIDELHSLTLIGDLGTGFSKWPTLADVDVELPVDRLTRDLHLELLGDMRFVERATAIRAAVR
jgi:hypothetical protein